MSRKELDLFQLSSRSVAQAGTSSTKVAGDFGGDRIDILERGGKKAMPPAWGGAALVAAAAVAGEEQSGGVDDGALHVLNAPDRQRCERFKTYVSIWCGIKNEGGCSGHNRVDGLMMPGAVCQIAPVEI